MGMTLLGTITVAAGQVQNNQTTAVIFQIPTNVPRVSLVLPTAASGLNIEISIEPLTLATANSLLQAGNQNVQFALPQNFGTYPFISIFNPGALSVDVKVYSLDGIAS